LNYDEKARIMAISTFCGITPQEASQALEVLHPIELLAEAAKARQEAFYSHGKADAAIQQTEGGVSIAASLLRGLPLSSVNTDPSYQRKNWQSFTG
jgi:hypothetical protein